MTRATADVAVVGGGPAGALTAMLLARAGHEVILLERAPHWRWRACGVFASPAGVAALRRLGVGEGDLERVARPLAAMRVESARGNRFRLTYGGTGALADFAVGFDRSALDPRLLELARAAGAVVREGATVEQIDFRARASWVTLSLAGGDELIARVVVGADGLRSMVARSAGVAQRAALGPRAALSFHLPDRSGGEEARIVVFDDGFVGLAPVPGDRVNVGIVLGRSWFAGLRRDGGLAVARQVLGNTLRLGARDLEAMEPLDRIAGVTPVGHAVSHRAGRGWLLVGDAAGFLDPFTGEGLHRALVSAGSARTPSIAARSGVAAVPGQDHDAAMRRRFATKDLVTRLVQGVPVAAGAVRLRGAPPRGRASASVRRWAW